MLNVSKTNPLLDRKGRPTAGTKVAMRPQAYANLMSAARSSMPEETVGALIGKTYPSQRGQQWITVEDITPVELVPAGGLGLTINRERWENLRTRFEGAEGGGLCIVGWFFADPGIGLFSSRVDVAEIQQAIAPCSKHELVASVNVFLLVNPATDQGAFFVSRGGSLAQTRGFYEILS